MTIEDQVILDPAAKDGSWAVVFGGRIVASGYNSKGAALASLGLYQSGYRNPKDKKLERQENWRGIIKNYE